MQTNKGLWMKTSGFESLRRYRISPGDEFILSSAPYSIFTVTVMHVFEWQSYLSCPGAVCECVSFACPLSSFTVFCLRSGLSPLSLLGSKNSDDNNHKLRHYKHTSQIQRVTVVLGRQRKHEYPGEIVPVFFIEGNTEERPIEMFDIYVAIKDGGDIMSNCSVSQLGILVFMKLIFCINRHVY